MQRREFHRMLALGVAAGLALPGLSRRSFAAGDGYDLPRFGNVHLLHMTDAHAQLLPIHYREPDLNIGVGEAANRAPHLVASALLKEFGIKPGSAEAHAFTSLDYVAAARHFGHFGGFAHLATLVKRLRANRPGALLLDGGDLWQGSATALWTRGQDMVEATRQLGIDVMTGHWEFTLGTERVQEILAGDLAGKLDFVAQNVCDTDFGDRVFASQVTRQVNGVSVAIIGQAFPFTPIANPAHLTTGWTFGIRERELQAEVDAARKAGAAVVVLLSHNGADVDLKIAARLSGLDAILGGHTHDAIPRAIEVRNPGGVTLVTNAGSNGKFLGVLDFDVREGKVAQSAYRLLPVFSNLLPPDPDMAALIEKLRAPFAAKLSRRLATSEGLLYRRGNFNGSFDQLICDALLQEKSADIAFSPGFRWGTTLLPGDDITMEALMNQVAITYPQTTLTTMSGERIKYVLEDVADNIFNPDPYYQQGGDMVRVGGMDYTISPNAERGARISDMRIGDKPIEAGRDYRVAGWAPVGEGVEGEPIWELVARWLESRRSIPLTEPRQPRILGMAGNRGMV